MMTRTLFAVLLLGVATASVDKVFTTECQANFCGDKIERCCVGGTLDKSTGTCSVSGSTKCYLCAEVDGLEKCPEAQSSSYVATVDENDNIEEPTVTSDVSSAAGSGTSSGLPSTRPNSGTTMTLGTYNGMAGWNDIEPSTFQDFAEFTLGLTATLPSFYTKSGYKVVYSCSGPASVKGCNIFVFLYRCPPCNSRSGDLPALLLAMDTPTWYAGNCGPSFKLNAEHGINHQFAIYSAEVASGSTTKIVLPNDVQFMFWALVAKSVVCQSKTTPTTCGAFPINCQWTDEGCRPRICERGSVFAGPSLARCEICVDDEEEFLPFVQM